MAKKSVRVTRLEARNFKRLHAVELTFDGAGLCVVGGANEAGKSSTLDALWAALGGQKAVPGVAVREGAKKGHATVQLDNGLTVKRTFTVSGGGSLKITDEEGRTHSSPQAILDAFVGTLSFDPLAFTRMTPAVQTQTLRDLTGLDFVDLDAERAEVYAERTGVNRSAKAARTRAEAIPADPEAPKEEVRLTDLVSKIQALEERNRVLAGRRREIETAQAAVRTANAEVARQWDIVRLAQEELTRAEVATTDAAAEVLRLEATPIPDDEDSALLRQRLETAEADNARVQRQQARAERLAEARKLETAADELTARLDAIDEEKAELLAAADMPVPGLGFDDSGVTLKGLPFSQASGAQQLRTSLAMGAAAAPELRMLLVRDGSLLDGENLAEVRAFAEEHDLQILMERVGDGEECGVIIEGGRVRGDGEEEAAGQGRLL